MSASNPFFHRGPVAEADYFFGRTQAWAHLSELLNARQHVAIHGQRRIGKTSLLFQLRRTPPPKTQVVYLDSGVFDGLDEEWFYGAIDQALGGEAAARTYPQFLRRLRTLAHTEQHLLLLIDEFELLGANPRFGHSFFNRLRGLAAQCPLQFVTASHTPLGQITFDQPETLSSPFFNIFANLPLPLFTEAEAQELLFTLSARAGQKFTNRTVTLILEFVGTHPLFVQIAGYHWFTAQGASPADPVICAAIEADLRQHLQYYWAHLPDEARYALSTWPQGLSAPMQTLLQSEGWLGMGVVGQLFIVQQSVEGVRWTGRFLLDTRRGLVWVNEKVLILTPTEFALLRLFIEHAGEVLSPEMLEKSLWPTETSPDSERARDAVKKLRAALGESGEALTNRRGVGWTLDSA